MAIFRRLIIRRQVARDIDRLSEAGLRILRLHSVFRSFSRDDLRFVVWEIGRREADATLSEISSRLESAILDARFSANRPCFIS
jgi:hypothetical protein